MLLELGTRKLTPTPTGTASWKPPAPVDPAGDSRGPRMDPRSGPAERGLGHILEPAAPRGSPRGAPGRPGGFQETVLVGVGVSVRVLILEGCALPCLSSY